MLAVAVNTAHCQAQDLQFNVEPWLEVSGGPLELRIIDQEGRLAANRQQKSHQFTVATPSLEQWGLCVIKDVPAGK